LHGVVFDIFVQALPRIAEAALLQRNGRPKAAHFHVF
jgi:hypothetical protein